MMLGLIGDLEGEREAAVDCLRLLGERGDIAVAREEVSPSAGMTLTGPDLSTPPGRVDNRRGQ